VKSSNLRIAYQCPQCGAPATLEETDRLFSCAYCRVKSYLISGDCFQFVLPHAAPKDKNLIFFPYWRFKGMLFSCVSSGIRQKFIDASHQAVKSEYFPHSLGFRPQALKLRFLTPETKGDFVRPQRAVDSVTKIFKDRFSAFLPKPVFHQAHIGESLSLIYAPYYRNQGLYDAVLNEPIVSDLRPDFEELIDKAGSPDWGIRFLPTLCPNCGWDLEGQRDALVLLCRNCNSAWTAGKDRFVRIEFAHMDDTGPNIIYLPFWRLKTSISGIDLDTYADLIKVANLPKVPRADYHDRPFCFWSLAFKIRPQTFLPLATKMTLSQPQQTLSFELPKSNLYPVNLPIQEAVETLKINLANFIKPRKASWPQLQGIEIKTTDYLLVYVPFHQKYQELTQPSCNFTITKTHLSLAKNL
jgi:DNA-directed RNA polymerase subunit RPC12/RpoP